MILNQPIFPGINSKSDSLIPFAFTGNPKKATVVFASPFEDASYQVVFSVNTDGSKTYSPAAESKTASGFVINLHSNNLAGLNELGWFAIRPGV